MENFSRLLNTGVWCCPRSVPCSGWCWDTFCLCHQFQVTFFLIFYYQFWCVLFGLRSLPGCSPRSQPSFCYQFNSPGLEENVYSETIVAIWFWILFLVVGTLSMLSTWWLLDITIAPSFGRLNLFLLACKMWSVLNILELILFFPNIDSWRLFSLRVPNTPPRVLSKYATFLNFNLFLFVLKIFYVSEYSGNLFL